MKNQSSYSVNVNNVTSFKMLNDKSLYFEHLKIIESRIWVHILKKDEKNWMISHDKTYWSIMKEQINIEYMIFASTKYMWIKTFASMKRIFMKKIKTLSWQMNDEKKAMRFILMTKMTIAKPRPDSSNKNFLSNPRIESGRAVWHVRNPTLRPVYTLQKIKSFNSTNSCQFCQSSISV